MFTDTAAARDRRTDRRSDRRRRAVRWFMLLVLFGLGTAFGAFLQANAMNAGGEDAAGAPAAVRAAEPAAGGTALPEDSGAVPKPSGSSLLCVAPGDTLWSIAEQYAPEGVPIKSYIRQIMQANSLTSAALQAGDVLILP